MRVEGVGSLYNGRLARDFITSASSAGYTVDSDRLRDALPRFERVDGLTHSDHTWTMTGVDEADTAFAQVSLDLILDGEDWTNDIARNQTLLATAITRATPITANGTQHLSDDAADDAMDDWNGERPRALDAGTRLRETAGVSAARTAGSTAFFAIDRQGLAVTCAIGLGAPFGTGKMAPGLGMMLADALAPSLSTVLVPSVFWSPTPTPTNCTSRHMERAVVQRFLR